MNVSGNETKRQLQFLFQNVQSQIQILESHLTAPQRNLSTDNRYKCKQKCPTQRAFYLGIFWPEILDVFVDVAQDDWRYIRLDAEHFVFSVPDVWRSADCDKSDRVRIASLPHPLDICVTRNANKVQSALETSVSLCGCPETSTLSHCTILSWIKNVHEDDTIISTRFYGHTVGWALARANK